MPVSKIWKLAEERGSRVILALDAPRGDPSELIARVEDYIVGVKVGLPLLLTWGLDELRNLSDKFSESLYMLCDFKLADIPDVVAEELKLIKGLGFDGAIVHLFQGGVEEVTGIPGRPEVFGIAAMTHKGSRLIDQHFCELVEAAVRAGLEGCVVPATKPEVIEAARRIAPSMLLLSPGVGAQGAPFGSAVASGADFEIVGRAIVASADPRSTARAARDEIRRRLETELKHEYS